jgi:RNA polymerase sigma-70 factor (ECF subfamily)
VSNENPEIDLDTKELVELIRQLPSGYQTVFNLVAIEGYDHIETARILDMNVNTVRSQYSRARAILIAQVRQHFSTKQKQTYSGKI